MEKSRLRECGQQKRKTDYQRARTKNKETENNWIKASTASRSSHWDQGHSSFWCLLGEWAYQKSLLITKVLQETITHMDGDDTEEKTERNTQFMYTPSKTTYQRTWSARSCYELLGWKQIWHSLVCTEIPSTNKACWGEFSVRCVTRKPSFKTILHCNPYIKLS